MPDFLTTDGHTQVIVPLRITPHTHKEMPTITGNAFSQEAGTVLYGNYNMEYLLSGGDRLRLIANHNKKTVQLMLFTHDSHLLKRLPGERASSLVADAIRKVHTYRVRSASYAKPLSTAQEQKLQLANECINRLKKLLIKERKLKTHDHKGHEKLRRKVIAVIELCRDNNRMLANNPVISEGSFGDILYDAHKAAQHYQFNRVFSVSRHDQMDFSKTSSPNDHQESPCFIWDSEIHIGHDSDELDNALRVICQHYQLSPAKELNNIPANRFQKLEHFFRQLWHDTQDWIEYLAIKTTPTHKQEITTRNDGVTITKITPYYLLSGLPQKGYPDLKSMVFNLTQSSLEPGYATNMRQAKKQLAQVSNGHWRVLANNQQLLLRLDNNLVTLSYFIHDSLFYPLPEGQDLYTLSQVSKRHLYLPERVSLRVKGFISRIPTFFKGFYERMKHFIMHDLHHEFFNHVHATHDIHVENPQEPPPSSMIKNSVHEALENSGVLANGQTLEEFIKDQISKSPYIIARPNHPPSPPAYDNPLHRALGVVRHLSSFFIDTSERNPIVGSLALVAYFYGAGAVLAPEKLIAVLTKLHLSGLISGIEPTQKLARLMSHGTISEAISASATLWQGMVVGGNLDHFFVSAVSILKDDPAEIAIIAALALSLGYGLTKAFPPLQEEMGSFPYVNYATLGGKGGAAIYDTIMHPGDDWLLGSFKWLCKCFIAIGKLLVSPFFEAYYYGYQEGFVNGWKKSGALAKRLSKQIIAACTDLILAIATIPILEVSALLIHVPFRGITNIVRKLFATLGNLSAVGQLFIDIGSRPSLNNYISDFKFLPLYGFNSPIGHFSDTLVINILINALRVIFLPPLELIKNAIVLPLIDLLSLILRVSLTLLNPITRLFAYAVGAILQTIGAVWDDSIGVLFSDSATGLTLLCNWIDNQASDLKQNTLSVIEVARGELYHWAFAEEDAVLHKELHDQDYYTSEPRRCELIPHSDSYCLLRNLLDENHNNSRSINNAPSQSHFQKLFLEKSSDSDFEEAFNYAGLTHE